MKNVLRISIKQYNFAARKKPFIVILWLNKIKKGLEEVVEKAPVVKKEQAGNKTSVPIRK